MKATISEALALALEHHQAGRLEMAEELYWRILTVEPNHPDALHLLGVIAHQTVAAVQDAFNAWRTESDRSLAEISRTLACSVA